MTTPPVVSITDELIAELEAACDDRPLIELGRSTIRSLLSHITDLKQQLAAASVDAERYRWLRSRPMACPTIGPDLATWAEHSGEALRYEEADRQIDAARDIADMDIGSGD